jgi:hypothetical protein
MKNFRYAKKTKVLILSIILSNILFWNCKNDDVESEENELITSIKLKFTQGTTTQTFTWKDLDGDGGAAPTKDIISLKPNTIYGLEVQFLNESQTPAVDITSEIKAEQDEHLLIYTPSPASLLTYTYGDKDSRNLPVGLVGTVKTNNAGVGTLKVQLRHQPPINGSPTKNGMTNAGSDDINVDFNVEVK